MAAVVQNASWALCTIRCNSSTSIAISSRSLMKFWFSFYSLEFKSSGTVVTFYKFKFFCTNTVDISKFHKCDQICEKRFCTCTQLWSYVPTQLVFDLLLWNLVAGSSFPSLYLQERKFQLIGLFTNEVIPHQSYKIGFVYKISFCKSSHKSWISLWSLVRC